MARSYHRFEPRRRFELSSAASAAAHPLLSPSLPKLSCHSLRALPPAHRAGICRPQVFLAASHPMSSTGRTSRMLHSTSHAVLCCAATSGDVSRHMPIRLVRSRLASRLPTRCGLTLGICPCRSVFNSLHPRRCEVWSKDKKLLRFWFHTAFVENGQLRLNKSEIDGPHKDRKCKQFDSEFYVEIFFDTSPSCDA